MPASFKNGGPARRPVRRLGACLQPGAATPSPGRPDPARALAGDSTPLRTLGDDELRWTLLEEKARRVRTSGVRFHGIDFVAPELNGLVGETVAVRYRPHDDTTLEVFRDDSHLCTALPQGALGPEERAAVLERRREDAAAQARLARRATRRARERFAPVTGPVAAEEVTVITAAAAAQERAGRDGDRLRRVAQADLLALPSGRLR